MIKSFNDKETQKIFNGTVSKRLPVDIQARAFNKLTAIHVASVIEDLRIPLSNCLEALRGDRNGQHSIRINDQYRVCFYWNNNNAENVEITDYH
ncbi:type II toxin-antitoxin system RelE/ParE family toxin [Treponema endosymbiont of Eucomonympha sp.]|uniref:type II toxin-antitoxin system RelE/ParE family toxin n=1 Tax=Treponema endosymbiont of Eucomonympha sp. TaxID=1580831 RepID=UPI000785324E|nr:type II toxin-antitoxin system RelE/ParE family toxin [Treponema endosymbiont of Eucomonympha sp.]